MTKPPATRAELFKHLFPDAPAYRWKQAEAALFDARCRDWNGATALPKETREALMEKIPWSVVRPLKVVESRSAEAAKALLELADGAAIETVLMRNKRGQWTVCVSSQVGCAMKCAFCATGRLGLTRDLNSDEIVDQLRFWRDWLAGKDAAGRISNAVFMGMGEPLANYENVRAALNAILTHTDIGPVHITVSTVGLLPRLETILTDKDWPPVRLAVSLHCADELTRKKLMPTTAAGFISKLADWSDRYAGQSGKRHHLTFEYVLLAGVNDSPRHAELLAGFARAAGRAKVNLIPYNATDSGFSGSDEAATRRFQIVLRQRGLDATRRRSLGQDIVAACGQLAGAPDK